MSKTNTTVELAVELTCQKCVTKTENVLSKVEGIQDFEVNLNKQSVLVTSALPTSKLLNIIESEVGKRAVVMGMGLKQKPLGAAVAMLGGIIGCGQVQVRLRKSRHANICSKNQFFRENVVVIEFSDLRPGSNERYENSTFYGPFKFLIFILISI